MFKTITEGRAKIRVPSEKKVSSKLPVFYNPVMKFNRDISITLLKAIDKKQMQIALPLAATGVRGIRFILELPKNKIKTISFNDNKGNFRSVIAANLALNKIKKNKKIIISNQDANLFMLNSTGFDYIDIDPFGSPNPFLDAAVRRLAREGILAVTATDTSALCGSFPKACMRKYWAVPVNNEQMYEFGLRILIRRVQLVGAQYDKALIPIFSYSKEHYMRVFFECKKSKEAVDKILSKHKTQDIKTAGPIWTGQLWDINLVARMLKVVGDEEIKKFLNIIKEESRINSVGYFDIHTLCKRYKLKTIPRKPELIKKLKAKYKAAETHFLSTAIKSNAPLNELLRILRC